MIYNLFFQNIRYFYKAPSLMSKLASVNEAVIDPSGTFKYVLIEAIDPVSKDSKLIVRGTARCAYHADIFDLTKSTENQGLSYNCLGGGRIKHDSIAKSILVYGYSQGFGQAEHIKAVEILKSKYPEYNISWSNEGY